MPLRGIHLIENITINPKGLIYLPFGTKKELRLGLRV